MDVDEVFGFHPATPATGPLHDGIRMRFRELAHDLQDDDGIPESREKSLCLTHLQTAMMFANAAVAIHHPGKSGPQLNPNSGTTDPEGRHNA